MHKQDRVHIDSDNEEWGRVASDATIIDIYQNDVLVNVDSIKADILVLKEDILPLTNHPKYNDVNRIHETL